MSPRPDNPALSPRKTPTSWAQEDSALEKALDFHMPLSIVQEEGVKRLLSEVPVEADGSVHFKVPAGKALHFQLLDENRRCLQTMRSFTGVMPGEVRGCLGCHEMHSASPATPLPLREGAGGRVGARAAPNPNPHPTLSLEGRGV